MMTPSATRATTVRGLPIPSRGARRASASHVSFRQTGLDPSIHRYRSDASTRVASAGTDGSKGVECIFECVVIENRAASVDGAKRTLVVAVEDKQSESAAMLRKSRNTMFNNDNGKVWTEMFHEPGQYVLARCRDGAETKLPLARSPYHVRYDSARLDSAKVEFLVDGEHHPKALVSAQPGDSFKVSEPHGSGFSNVLFAERDLEAAMRKNHSLVLVANGTNGFASIRALLDWQPVMAYADQHPVSVFYLCESQESAALLSLHDEWRSEGFKIVPCYGSIDDQMFMIEQCILTGAEAAGGKPTIFGADVSRSASVLLAGASGSAAKNLLDLFVNRGVSRDNILTSDFY